MNYIELINDFWTFCEEKDVSATEKVTYFAILNYCNKLNWKNPFFADWSVLIQYSGISKNSHYSALETLHNMKLIEYKRGEKNKLKAQIFIPKLKNKTKNNFENNFETKTENKTKTKIANLDKQENNETNKPINNVIEEQKKVPPKPKKEIIIPDLFEFLEYVKSIPEYKNQFDSLKFSIQSKYESWIDNNWKDGNDTKIINWKTKIKNVLPYLKPQQNATTSNFTKPTITDRTNATIERLNREREELINNPWNFNK